MAERQGGRLGGFVWAGQRDYAEGCETSPVAYLEEWFVERDLRRLGLGRTLVKRAEGWARERGLQELASDTGLENILSQAAHRALGFAEVERIVCFRKALA